MFTAYSNESYIGQFLSMTNYSLFNNGTIKKKFVTSVCPFQWLFWLLRSSGQWRCADRNVGTLLLEIWIYLANSSEDFHVRFCVPQLWLVYGRRDSFWFPGASLRKSKLSLQNRFPINSFRHWMNFGFYVLDRKPILAEQFTVLQAGFRELGSGRLFYCKNAHPCHKPESR